MEYSLCSALLAAAARIMDLSSHLNRFIYIGSFGLTFLYIFIVQQREIIPLETSPLRVCIDQVAHGLFLAIQDFRRKKEVFHILIQVVCLEVDAYRFFEFLNRHALEL